MDYHGSMVGLAIACAYLAVGYLSGALCTRSRSAGVRVGTCIAVTGALVLYAALLRDDPWVLRALPLTEALVVFDPCPFALGFLAAAAIGNTRLSVPRRAVYGTGLLAGAAACIVPLVVVPSVPCLDRWSDGVCLQSQDYSCAPAAAATLLRLHGTATTEGEMSRLCSTTTRGTRLYAAFRGLRRLAPNTSVFHVADPRTMDWSQLPVPGIYFVALRADVDRRDARYRELYGWRVGVPHAVVVLAVGEELLEIGDPAVGREHWRRSEFVDLWSGTGLYLPR